MTYEHLRLETTPSVARVTLTRPEVRNALSDRTLQELLQVLEGLATDATLRVVILGGEGKVFCAGADLEWMKRAGELPEEAAVEDALLLVNVLERLDRLPQAVIARVHGAALGGAMGLVAASDIVVAERNTRFGFPEVRLGLVPATISPYVLRKIPESQARRFFLTGELFDAETARMLGLVHEVVEGMEALDEAVNTLVSTVLANGPEAVKEAKRLIRTVKTMNPGEVSLYTAQLLARIRQTPEAREGFQAFLEKRTPSWRKGGVG